MTGFPGKAASRFMSQNFPHTKGFNGAATHDSLLLAFQDRNSRACSDRLSQDLHKQT